MPPVDWKQFVAGDRVKYINTVTHDLIGLYGTVIESHPRTGEPTRPYCIHVLWDVGMERGWYHGVWPESLEVVAPPEPEWEI